MSFRPSAVETNAVILREEKFMEEALKNRGVACPQLLDLIPNEREWPIARGAGGIQRGRVRAAGLDASEEKKLELRLGLPGGEEEESSVLSLGFLSKASTNSSAINRRAEAVKEGSQQQQLLEAGCFQRRAGSAKAWPHKPAWVSAKVEQQQSLESEQAHAASGNAAGPNTSSHTRTTRAVVGWPPIRPLRRNLATSSVKQSGEHEINTNIETKPKGDSSKKSLLVKINMDGIPIGRKVDLNAYDNYEKLSSAVENLFLGLLEAQKDTSTTASNNDAEAKQAFKGLLDGSGEYTLVYEDNEGDRILVGDVPWKMFLSTVRRLRVLKSSDVSALRLGAVSRERTATEC